MAAPSQPGADPGGVVMSSAFPLDGGSDKHRRFSGNGFPPDVHDGTRPNVSGEFIGREPDPDARLFPGPERALLGGAHDPEFQGSRRFVDVQNAAPDQLRRDRGAREEERLKKEEKNDAVPHDFTRKRRLKTESRRLMSGCSP